MHCPGVKGAWSVGAAPLRRPREGSRGLDGRELNRSSWGEPIALGHTVAVAADINIGTVRDHSRRARAPATTPGSDDDGRAGLRGPTYNDKNLEGKSRAVRKPQAAPAPRISDVSRLGPAPKSNSEAPLVPILDAHAHSSIVPPYACAPAAAPRTGSARAAASARSLSRTSENKARRIAQPCSPPASTDPATHATCASACATVGVQSQRAPRAQGADFEPPATLKRAPAPVSSQGCILYCTAPSK